MRQKGQARQTRTPAVRPRPRRGGCARRGDVRAAILALLGESPMHGYQIIQELETRSNGLWHASPGDLPDAPTVRGRGARERLRG